MILHSEFIKAKTIVDNYNMQREETVLNVNELVINQKIRRKNLEEFDYWVSEILFDDVLIRTTENEDDKEYNDFWVNISELRPICNKPDMLSAIQEVIEVIDSAGVPNLEWIKNRLKETI